jgi:phytoene/squalene synthetase
MESPSEREIDTVHDTVTPPRGVDVNEALDPYDRELAETFPASDPPESAHP